MFKYYRIPDRETVDKIIGRKPSIKFTPASDLNDPFELKFNLELDPFSKESKKAYFKKFPNHGIDDYNVWQAGIDDKFIWMMEQNMRKQLCEIYSLTCFSDNNSNNLMWSHYADNHTGICVEYLSTVMKNIQKNEQFLSSGNVSYADNPPVINVYESAENQVKKIFFNKQLEWSYEKEFRALLRCDNNTEYIQFEQSLIGAVYIGSKCSQDISSEVVSICNKAGIKVYHAITMGKSYKTEFKEHQEGVTFMKSFW